MLIGESDVLSIQQLEKLRDTQITHYSLSYKAEVEIQQRISNIESVPLINKLRLMHASSNANTPNYSSMTQKQYPDSALVFLRQRWNISCLGLPGGPGS